MAPFHEGHASFTAVDVHDWNSQSATAAPKTNTWPLKTGSSLWPKRKLHFASTRRFASEMVKIECSSPICENAWGKLPSKRRPTGSYSSLSRPTSF